MKNINRLASDFNEFRTTKKVNCESHVNYTQDEIYSSVVTMFRETSYNASKDCIMKVLTSFAYAELAMERAVYQESETLTKSEKNQKFAQMNLDLTAMSDIAVTSCVRTYKFGELFDDIFDLSIDIAMKHCAIERLIQSNVINTKLYNIDLKLYNGSFEELNCDDTLKKTFDDLENMLKNLLRDDTMEFREKQVKCAIELFRNRKNSSEFLKIAVLSLTNISENQKEVDRQYFIQFMKTFSDTLEICEIRGYRAKFI